MKDFSNSVSEHKLARQTQDAFWNGIKQLGFMKFMLHDTPMFIQDIPQNARRIDSMLDSKLYQLIGEDVKIKSSGTMPIGRVRLPKKDAAVIRKNAKYRKAIMDDPNWNKRGKAWGIKVSYPNRSPYPDNIERKVV